MVAFRGLSSKSSYTPLPSVDWELARGSPLPALLGLETFLKRSTLDFSFLCPCLEVTLAADLHAASASLREGGGQSREEAGYPGGSLIGRKTLDTLVGRKRGGGMESKAKDERRVYCTYFMGY